MQLKSKVELQADVKAAVQQKTPEERQASLDRLDAEIVENAAEAIRASFARVFLALPPVG